MKKIFYSFVLLAFMMLDNSSVVKATTVTFYVNINITDTCSPSPYHGYYCVRIKLMYNSTEICETQNCNITGSGCWSFTCDINSSSSDKYYWIEHVDIIRYPGQTCYSTSGTDGSPDVYWTDLFNCSTTQTISFTL